MPNYHHVRAGLAVIHKLHTICTIPQLHTHNSYEILVPFGNDMKCIINNKVHVVNKGDVFIFPPHIPHKVDLLSCEMYERYIIYFKKEDLISFSPFAENLLRVFINNPTQEVPLIHLEEEQTANLISLIKKTQQYIDSPDYAQEIYIKHALFEILLLLSRQAYIQNSNLGMSKNTCNFKVEDVLNYVNCNLSEDLSLDSLTAKFYMSKTYLNKMIKANTGYTVNQYIIKIRVETAKKLLRRGMPVSQIYEKIGFNNYSHFIRTFTKIVGISPKQYAINFEKSKQQIR